MCMLDKKICWLQETVVGKSTEYAISGTSSHITPSSTHVMHVNSGLKIATNSEKWFEIGEKYNIPLTRKSESGFRI